MSQGKTALAFTNHASKVLAVHGLRGDLWKPRPAGDRIILYRHLPLARIHLSLVRSRDIIIRAGQEKTGRSCDALKSGAACN